VVPSFVHSIGYSAHTIMQSIQAHQIHGWAREKNRGF
jgi:hypothetical protein